MSQLKLLRTAENLSDLAKILELKPAQLSFIIYVRSDTDKYTKFEIPKKSGGTRTISKPSDELSLIQWRLANLLQNCLAEIPRFRAPEKSQKDRRVSHGFMRGLSIVTNARKHRNKRYVFNIDLNDFFGAINFGRVRGFFINDHNFKLNHVVATIIAKIACIDNCLPQGSPSSPIISNLIGGILDSRLSKITKENKCTYSRYADDITFSTNERAFPAEIATLKTGSFNDWEAGEALNDAIRRSGFSINTNKTRMQYSDSRQEVTGLIVNDLVNTRFEYRRLARAMVHSLVTRGNFYLPKRAASLLAPEEIDVRQGSILELQGMLEFISYIDAKRHNDKIPDGKRTETLKKFLFYKDFYAAGRPTIICEGETDNIYLTHAIRGNAEKYPNLASIDSNGRINLKLRRYNSKKNKARELFKLNGGSGDLKNFITYYQKEADKFSAPAIRSPIIILLDNDEGCISIVKSLKEKNSDARTSEFTHVSSNLYLVLTPKIEGQDSCIEDFFDSNTLDTSFEGKTFSKDNTLDTKSHFGKMIFAHKVVKPNADKINFVGFQAILDRIVMAMAHFNDNFIKPSP